VGATGTVTFSIDGTVVSTQSVASGQASFSTSALSVGSHTITVTYSGDSHFAAGSNSVVQAVNTPAPALLSLTSSQNPSVVGQPVTFAVTVSNAAVAAAVNGVPVAFYDGTTPLGVATAQNGQATLTTSALLAGSHAISAQVPGTAIALTIGQVVNGMASATGITATPSPGVSGQPINLTAQVGPASGNLPAGIPAPTGTITFQDNGSTVGTATLTATGATWSLGNPGIGTHQFTAIYSGDKFWGSSFGRVSDTVSAPPVTLSSAAASLSSAFAPDEEVSLYNVPGLNGNTSSSLPLGTSLAGVSVTITDSTGVSGKALIYGVYASAGQINLVFPSGLAAGPATVTITLPGGTTVTSKITIANTAPAVYTAGMNGQGVFAGQIVYVQPDSSQNIVSSTNPVSFTSGDPVFLILYGTGIRHYSSSVTATVNGVSVPALAVPQPTYPGLDQINLGPLPSSLAGAGTVNIVITVDGQAANTVTVTIQ
jgi:large repetitive protein